MTTPAGRKTSPAPQASQASQASQADVIKAKKQALAVAAKASSNAETPQSNSVRSDIRPKATGWRKIFGLKPALTSREKAIEIVLTLAELAMNSPDFLRSEGIFRKSVTKTEKTKASKNPVQYFRENRRTGDPRKHYAVAAVMKESLKVALGIEEKITLALVAGVDPEELKAHIHPDFKEMVDALLELILSDDFSVEVPLLFTTLAKLCHAVTEHTDENKMGLGELAVCIAPNLMPPVDDFAANQKDIERKMAFVKKLNESAADLMKFWMTGEEPEFKPKSEHETAYSTLKISQASEPLHRTYSQAMQHKYKREESYDDDDDDVQYAVGLRWQSRAAVSTTSIYSTVGGISISDSEADYDYDCDYGYDCDCDYGSVDSAGEYFDEECTHMSLDELRDLQRQEAVKAHEEAMVEAAGYRAQKRRQSLESSSHAGNDVSSPTGAPPIVHRHLKPQNGVAGAPPPVPRHLKPQNGVASAPPPVPRHLKPAVPPEEGASLNVRSNTPKDPFLSELKQAVQKKR